MNNEEEINLLLELGRKDDSYNQTHLKCQKICNWLSIIRNKLSFWRK